MHPTVPLSAARGNLLTHYRRRAFRLFRGGLIWKGHLPETGRGPTSCSACAVLLCSVPSNRETRLEGVLLLLPQQPSTSQSRTHYEMFSPLRRHKRHACCGAGGHGSHHQARVCSSVISVAIRSTTRACGMCRPSALESRINSSFLFCLLRCLVRTWSTPVTRDNKYTESLVIIPVQGFP